MSSEKQFNSLSFDFDIGTNSINVMSMGLSITDNSAPATENGRPDGWVQGTVEANGEIVLSIPQFKKIVALAKDKGAFQELDPFDINCFAKAGSQEFKIEAFGCKLKVSDVLNADKSSSDKSSITLPYDVTSKDFVHIDGVPYILPEEN